LPADDGKGASSSRMEILLSRLAWDITLVQTFIVTEDNVLPDNNGLDQPFDMIWVQHVQEKEASDECRADVKPPL
jgi:hypothetical protein